MLVTLLLQIDFSEGMRGFVVQGVAVEQYFERLCGFYQPACFKGLLSLLVEVLVLRRIGGECFRLGATTEQDDQYDYKADLGPVSVLLVMDCNRCEDSVRTDGGYAMGL